MPRRLSTTKKNRSTKSKSRSTISKKKDITPIRVFQQSFSFNSSPSPGSPYGELVTLKLNNGKGIKTVSELNRNGRPINTKEVPVKR